MRGARRRVLERLADRVECEQATARGAVVPGAEGERRFDLDADAVARHPGAVVRAVDDEAPGGDRRQSGEALTNPVRRFDAAEAQSRGRRGSGRRLHGRPHRVAVARRAEMDRDIPAPAANIGHAHGDIFGGKAIGDGIADTERRPFIGYQPCNQGRHMRGLSKDLQKTLMGYSLSSWSPVIHSKSVQKSARLERSRLFHTTTPDLSTGYLASLQQLFPPAGRNQMADQRVLRELHLAVANSNSTPEFQKFAMIRLILKLA